MNSGPPVPAWPGNLLVDSGSLAQLITTESETQCLKDCYPLLNSFPGDTWDYMWFENWLNAHLAFGVNSLLELVNIWTLGLAFRGVVRRTWQCPGISNLYLMEKLTLFLPLSCLITQ